MNVNERVMNALKDIGIPVSFLKNSDNPKPPIYITFFEVTGIPILHSDNKAKGRTVTIQVDLWGTYGNSLFKLQKDVITAMEEVGFRLSAIRPDMYEEETNIVHKPLEFKLLVKRSE